MKCLTVGIKKTILHNVTGHFESGEFTVIIGPSGAGKTTLLKIISGERWLNVDGTVTINGVERNRGSFRKQICFVPQQFALLPLLTTRETLYMAARLKLDIKQSKQDARLIVSANTTKRCLNTLFVPKITVKIIFYHRICLITICLITQ